MQLKLPKFYSYLLFQLSEDDNTGLNKILKFVNRVKTLGINHALHADAGVMFRDFLPENKSLGNYYYYNVSHTQPFLALTTLYYYLRAASPPRPALRW